MFSDLPPTARLPMLVLGMLSLLGGTLAGLARLGLEVPALAAAQAGSHAALMISAFFGTVISLERAVALGRRWAYLAPAAAGLSGILLLAAGPSWLAGGFAVLASGVLVAASGLVLRRQRAVFTLVLALAAGAWSVGNVLWLVSGEVPSAVPWWLAFLVLTIAGERLELTRFLPTPARARQLFSILVAGVLAAALVSFWLPEAGLRIFAAALFGLALWLLRFDLAGRNIRLQGLTRFIAVCLMSGYVWLALAGLLGMAGGLAPGHAWRDAALHGVGLGFVFAMVFGHAPMIFPAVMRVKIPYHPFFYFPLAVLHFSVAVRIAGGLSGHAAVQQAGALANAAALLLFVLTIAGSVVRGRLASKP